MKTIKNLLRISLLTYIALVVGYFFYFMSPAISYFFAH